jgi:hypothetical protein
MTLHDYQLNMIQKLAFDLEGWKPSELYVIAGRQSGKSTLNFWLQNNLCKEITLPMKPKPKYKFSRANWYVAEFNIKDYTDVAHWCREQFGPHPRNPDAWSRWVHQYEDKIHFRDSKDYEWFMLRWS